MEEDIILVFFAGTCLGSASCPISSPRLIPTFGRLSPKLNHTRCALLGIAVGSHAAHWKE